MASGDVGARHADIAIRRLRSSAAAQKRQGQEKLVEIQHVQVLRRQAPCQVRDREYAASAEPLLNAV